MWLIRRLFLLEFLTTERDRKLSMLMILVMLMVCAPRRNNLKPEHLETLFLLEPWKLPVTNSKDCVLAK